MKFLSKTNKYPTAERYYYSRGFRNIMGAQKSFFSLKSLQESQSRQFILLPRTFFGQPLFLFWRDGRMVVQWAELISDLFLLFFESRYFAPLALSARGVYKNYLSTPLNAFMKSKWNRKQKKVLEHESAEPKGKKHIQTSSLTSSWD